MSAIATNFQVEQVIVSKHITIKGSEFIAYTLKVDNPTAAALPESFESSAEREVEILQRPVTPPPQAGDVIFAEVFEGPYGWKMKRARNLEGGRPPVSYGSAPLPSGNGVAAGPQVDSFDRRQQMIVRQSCQKVAATLTHIQGQGFDKERFKELVDWLQSDAEGLRPSLAEAPEASTADEEIPF